MTSRQMLSMCHRVCGSHVHMSSGSGLRVILSFVLASFRERDLAERALVFGFCVQGGEGFEWDLV